MARPSATETTPISVNFTAAEKRMLMQRSRETGQILAEYIRERVLAEVSCEEQVLRFLADELTQIAKKARRVVAAGQAQIDVSTEELEESLEAQRARIVKEVRESLSEQQIDALAHFLKPAFDAGLWPGSPS